MSKIKPVSVKFLQNKEIVLMWEKNCHKDTSSFTSDQEIPAMADKYVSTIAGFSKVITFTICSPDEISV